MSATRTANPYGLEFEPSNVGREADAYAVSATAGLLVKRSIKPAGLVNLYHECARHAVALHVISGKLHRLSERQCNEDLACPVCQGVGTVGAARVECRACAGRGTTTGRKETKLEAGAKEIAARYGLVAYFQGDPRGCSLYLIDPASYKGLSGAPSPEAQREFREWVSENYNCGHGIVRLGR